ncbi:hypothetical protein RSOLAG22IIIB_13733 [Rhizoctonia solani]|uniref:Amine oxidase domain-containing protein n=1 Tax=Rhizoctonia solani TaxID=456999 RepID=A0A0K6FQ74_9AGAM|nr:hypothetical protein RSOLAG22IIIB_13733 [Rhizoctonia solani]
MAPTTDLMDYLDVPRKEYIMSDKLKNNFSYFNGVRLSDKEMEAKIHAGDYDVFETGLPLLGSPDDILQPIFGPFLEKLYSPIPEIWQAGLRELRVYDDWSTRGFMRFRPDLKPPKPEDCLTQDVISYLEAIETATSVQFGKRVTAIAPVIPKGEKQIKTVRLTINDEQEVEYDHVISAIPLGCLSIVDLSQCNFKPRWETTWPIRQLRYDSSVKVAIRFSRRWWETLPKPQIGGVSSTDRPTRIVVYPSYDLGGTSATIIVSYTWAQDAHRLGTGVDNDKGSISLELLNVILRDLADIHGIKDDKYLPNLMEEHHAWDWYNDPLAMGAFGLFAPAQFNSLYPLLTRPAFGRLHFAGEATSVHHGWVVGALYSAFRCLAEVFYACGRTDLIEKLREKGSPFASAGVEDNEVAQELVKTQVGLGNYYGEELAKAILAHDSAGH